MQSAKVQSHLAPVRNGKTVAGEHEMERGDFGVELGEGVRGRAIAGFTGCGQDLIFNLCEEGDHL